MAATRASQNRPLRAAYGALVGWAFRRFYGEFAWTYDAVAWLVSRGLWYRWVLAALPYLRGRTVELGCGTGYMQHALATLRPHQAIGLDASPFMLAHTRRRVQGRGLTLRLVRAVAQALPLQSHQYDTVLATFPTGYILHPHTLAEVCRVLVAGGRLVLVDAAQIADTGLYGRVVALAYRLALLGSGPAAAQQHPYLDALTAAGFDVQVFTEQVGASRVHIFVATCAAPR